MKITVILYKSNTLANGEHPLMLRISQNKTRKYISLGISSSADLWDFKKNIPKRHHPHKTQLETIIAQTIINYRTKLFDLVSEQKAVSPHELRQAVQTGTRKNKDTCKLFPFFDQVINKFLEIGKVGNANVYKDTRNSLKRFNHSNDLLFSQIDQTFLANYEHFLRKSGLVENTMARYLSTLRAIFNKAIQEKLINPKYYPFKEFNISKFNTATKKRAITKEEIKKIESLDIDPVSSLYESRHYFLFSYYGQGINFKDIAHLQWKDIIEDRVVYTRAKTGKLIQFKLLAPSKAIIHHYRPLTGSHPDEYIFPILKRKEHLTALQIDNRIGGVLRRVNKELKVLAGLAQIDANLTTYVARHTYATVLRKSGVLIGVIGEALGHRNQSITEQYLKSFGNEVIDLANECLL